MKTFLAIALILFAITSGAAEPVITPRLVAAVPIAGAPEGAQAYRVVYRSTDSGDKAIDVTGLVIVPAGDPPVAGRDIVA